MSIEQANEEFKLWLANAPWVSVFEVADEAHRLYSQAVEAERQRVAGVLRERFNLLVWPKGHTVTECEQARISEIESIAKMLGLNLEAEDWK